MTTTTTTTIRSASTNAGPAAATPADPAAPDGLSRLAERALDAWNHHDVIAILSDYHPDATYDAHDGTPPTSGLDALAARYTQLLASTPNLRFEPVNVHYGDNFFVAEARASFGGDETVSFDVVDVVTVDNDRLLRKDSYIGRPHHRSASAGAGDRHTEFLAAFETAWRDPSADPLTDLFTDDAVLRHPGMATPIRGHDAIHAYWQHTLDGFDRIRATVLDHASSGTGMFLHIELAAVRDTNQLHWDAVDRFELDGPKAKTGTAYFDPDAILITPIITAP